uniref:Uncharacterized protein n=1 Tax=Meloidogyne hapla TaxID=6305 RepID=A0A1I8BBC3_MELHA
MLQCKIVRGPYCTICTTPSINELCINECLKCEYNKEYNNNLIKNNEDYPFREFKNFDEVNTESSDIDKSNFNKNEIEDVGAEEDENVAENYFDLNLEERENRENFNENLGSERLHFNKKLFL